MNAIDEAIYDGLNQPTLNAFVSGRIYRDVAPSRATYPLVIYRHVAGGEENQTPIRSVDVRYDVFVESDQNADEAGDIATIIDTLLHLVAMTVAGHIHIATTKGQLLSVNNFDEVTGRQYFVRGAVYRVRAEKT